MPRPTSASTRVDDELEGALQALSHDQLRALLQEYITWLPHPERVRLRNLAMPVATRSAGWRPGRDSSLLGDADAFLARARRRHEADPRELDELLARCTKAFFAGDFQAVRGVQRSVLEPVFDGDIYLGQDEGVDEVLATDLADVAARHLVAVYMTTELTERPAAVWDALEFLRENAHISSPLKAMKGAAAGALPDWTAFAMAWLELVRSKRGEEREYFMSSVLLDAATEAEGVEGLKRIAADQGDYGSLATWVAALAAQRAWQEALDALNFAAERVESPSHKGTFLNEAAHVAAQFGGAAPEELLMRAWRANPTTQRLLLLLGSVGADDIDDVLRRELDVFVRGDVQPSPQARGLLDLLAGEYTRVAKMVSDMPGLAWSNFDGPGTLVFPGLLIVAVPQTFGTASVSRLLSAALEHPMSDMLPGWCATLKPLPGAPVVELLVARARRRPMSAEEQQAALVALRAAAERRVEASSTGSGGGPTTMQRSY